MNHANDARWYFSPHAFHLTNAQPEASASTNATLLPDFGMGTSLELVEFLKYQGHADGNRQGDPLRCDKFRIQTR